MRTNRIVMACALVLVASGVFAQAAETPSEKPPAAKDCMKPHDHGAERQMPTPSKGCASADKATKAKASTRKNKAIEGHDHGKMHKNQ